jgi:hypothetical protein
MVERFFAGTHSVTWILVDNDNNPTHCNGHGTHVSGTIGGTTVGHAKQVSIHPVRVLGCKLGLFCEGPETWVTVTN